MTNHRQEQEQAATQSAVGLQGQHVSQPARQANDGAEAKEDEEEAEQELLPMRAAPHPAGPSRAVGQHPSAPAATSPSPWWGASERCETRERARREAVPVSPGVKGEHVSNAVAGAMKPDTATMSTWKRKREQSLLLEGAVTAARPASATASAAAGAAASSLAVHRLPASSSGGYQGSKMPSPTEPSAYRRYAHTHSLPDTPTLARRYAHTHGLPDSPTLLSPASSSLPIILSDSEDEEPSPHPKPTPDPQLLQIPASTDHMSFPRQTPTPTPTPAPRTRKPPGFSSKGPSAAVGFSQGSADSPIVIVLSDSDDSNSPKTKRTAEDLAGMVRSRPNPKSQHEMTRRSTAKGSRRSQGTACPSVSKAPLQAEPFDLEMKDSNAPSPSSLITSHSPVEKLPTSKQAPLAGSTDRSLTLARTLSPAADAAELQESMRQAALSSALVSVPRRPKSACKPSSHPSSKPPSNLSSGPSTGPSSRTITASAGELFFPSFAPCLGDHLRASRQQCKLCGICMAKSAIMHSN